MILTAGVAVFAACGTRSLVRNDGSAPVRNDSSAPTEPFQLLTYQSPGHSGVHGVAVAPNGDVFVVGGFNGLVDLDPSASVDLHTSVGGGGNSGHGGPPEDGFISRLRPDGVPIWTRILAGTGHEAIGSLVVDDTGSVVVAGWFNGNVDLDPGPGEDLRATESNADGFVMKLSATGERVWIWTLGAESSCRVEKAGANLLVAGYFTGPTDFDPGPGTDVRSSRAGDAFVIQLNASGQPIRPAWTFGGGLDVDTATSLGMGGDGSLYLAGQFSDGVDLDPGPGQASLPMLTQTTLGGYALALGAAGDLRWARAYAYADGVALSIGQDGGVVIRGSFHGEADFDPGEGTDVRASRDGLRETFVTKLNATGGYAWTRTWSRLPLSSTGFSLAAALQDGSVVLAGNFQDEFQIEDRTFFNQGNFGTFLVGLSPRGETQLIQAIGETERPSATPSQARFAMATSLLPLPAGMLFLGGIFGGQVAMPPAGVAQNANGVSGFIARLPVP